MLWFQSVSVKIFCLFLLYFIAHLSFELLLRQNEILIMDDDSIMKII